MKKRKQTENWLINPQQIEGWLNKTINQLQSEDYKGAIRTGKRILRYLPKNDPVRAETLGYLGSAYAARNAHEKAYQSFEEAVEITPDDSYYWFNYALACLRTARSGKAYQALKLAVALEGEGEMAARFAEKLALVQEMVQTEAADRGPDFTIEQLIEQQERFQKGFQLMAKKQWKKAERYFRETIAMGDCRPQPWGNLGICLTNQKRFDEAEKAYQRALAIDPTYELAKINRQMLANLRANPDLKPEFQSYSAADALNASILFVEED